MKKKEAIEIINASYKNSFLSNYNTHWSDNVDYGNDYGWWLNIPFHKFKTGFYMILNDIEKESIIFLKVPANKIQNPERRFRNKGNTADIFISYNDKERLTDIQSNSTDFQFAEFVIEEIPWK